MHQDVSADFSLRLMNDLSHAYTLVLVVAIVVVALTLVPVAFLPNKPPAARPYPSRGAGLGTYPGAPLRRSSTWPLP